MITLSDVPSGVYHSLIIIGSLGIIASYFVKFIPFIYRYLIPLQLLSILLLVAGIYYSGVTANEAKWQAEVKKLKEDVLIAEERSRNISAKVEYVFLDRVQKVKDVQVVVQEKLRDISVSIDSQCKVSPEAVDLVNAAAKNIKPGEKK